MLLLGIAFALLPENMFLSIKVMSDKDMIIEIIIATTTNKMLAE